MSNRDASAALGCALQWNGSCQYGRLETDAAVKMAQDALRSVSGMEEQIRELTKTNRCLQAELEAAVKDLQRTSACFACKNFKRNAGDCAGGCTCAHAIQMAELAGVEYTGPVFEWRGAQMKEEEDV